MEQSAKARRFLRFDAFEVDLEERELRRSGLKIKIQEQPFQILVMLLERPGAVLAREDLQKALWPDGTFVDFEHGLNTAVKKLREALGDSAEIPRFVETVARRGYRFIGNAELPAATPSAQPRPWQQPFTTRNAVGRFVLLTVLLLITGLAGAVLIWRSLGRTTVPTVTSSRPLTSGANVLAPNRFHIVFPQLLTDGGRIYFSAVVPFLKWDGRVRVAQASVTGGEISLLPLPFEAFVLDLSSDNGKLLLREIPPDPMQQEGPLWEVSTTGGNLIRLGNVVAQGGAWSPDGTKLVFSKGKALYIANHNGSDARKLQEVEGYAYWIRWSPDGSRLRFTLVDNSLAMSLWEISIAHIEGQ